MRQLRESDRDAVLRYLYQDPNRNIFPIGDIETFGFDQDFQQVYADIDVDGMFRSVFLRYRDNGIFYSTTNPSPAPYIELVSTLRLQHFSMMAPLADHWMDILSDYDRTDMHFAVCDPASTPASPTQQGIAAARSDDEFGALYDLLLAVPQFHIARESKADYIEGKHKSIQMGTTLYLRHEGNVVATAATTAETTRSAMVVAVATHPAHRNQGHASRLVKALIERYRERNKGLCLFYDNPDAGRIYRRLGFVEDGMWTLFRKRSTP